jgi:hypothetical protein
MSDFHSEDTKSFDNYIELFDLSLLNFEENNIQHSVENTLKQKKINKTQNRIISNNFFFNNRHLLYSKFDVHCEKFDLLIGQRIVLPSLSSYIVNQRLCYGEPIMPELVSKHEDYLSRLSTYLRQHKKCPICVLLKNNSSLYTVSSKENEIYYYNNAFFLPKWIANQFLFQDEPIALPVDDLNTFYQIFIKENNSPVIVNHEYYQYLYDVFKSKYDEQHKKWFENLNEDNRQLYITFKKQVEKYKMLIGEK